MSNSMQHLNGMQICVIDTETTGLDPYWHEMIELCLLPLDANLEVRKDVMPFCVTMKLDFPERIDKAAIKCNNKDLHYVQMHGFDKEKVKDLLRNWIQKLGLGLTTGGKQCKIRPLGQNFAFDRGFISQWLGISEYEDIFDYHYLDTMITANYLNDRAAFHGAKVPHVFVGLQKLAHHYGIDTDRAHTALGDCVTTARVYKKMCQQGLLG